MTEFVFFIRDYWIGIFDVLNSFSFTFWNLQVSILDILIGFIIFAMALSFLWRGVKG